eukprot:scaffold20852_cov23-Cyclotella_meneghiniana.AAC.3
MLFLDDEECFEWQCDGWWVERMHGWMIGRETSVPRLLTVRLLVHPLFFSPTLSYCNGVYLSKENEIEVVSNCGALLKKEVVNNVP